MELILASQSPRRRELLAQMGLRFTVHAADIDETMDPGLPAGQEVARVSRAKALAVARGPEDVVIAADTVVVCQGKILGKPHTPERAVEMLKLLSGRDHQVLTGCTVLRGETVLSHLETTHLYFRPLSGEEIAAYVATGEPLDKAGAYGIQGLGGLFVRRLEGDYYNVMGLPLCALTGLLRQVGVPVLGTCEEVRP